jgi:hypothetical protein
MTDVVFTVEIDDETIEVVVDDPGIDVTVEADVAAIVAVGGPSGPAGQPGGVVERVTAAALSGHKLVVPLDDGTVNYGDSSNILHANRPVWLTTGAWGSGVTATLVAAGPVTEPSWNWTPGLPIWLGLNGALTQTIPVSAVFARQVARVINATTLEFTTQQPIMLA